MKTNVSVIIPVFNADQYINQAVESSLCQPETGEVILIEDGSSDNSLEICQGFASINEKVVLLRHKDGVNRGAAASRNLGMKNARCDFIAFLDADDFFLPGRFKSTNEIFKSFPDCEGVYESVGTYYTDKRSEESWRRSNETAKELTSLKESVDPDDLFKTLLKRGPAHIQINGLTLKRSALEKSGYMDENLKSAGEDVDFILRLADSCSLRAGNLIEPVAMRRVHDGNSFWRRGTEVDIYKSALKMYKSTFSWLTHHSDASNAELLLGKLRNRSMNSRHFKNDIFRFFPLEIKQRMRLLCLLVEFPHVACSHLYWRKFLPIRFQNAHKYTDAEERVL